MSTANIVEAPTYRPTFEEFSDFSKYLHSIEDELRLYGICKIIPPKEWKRDFDYSKLDEMVIPSPIKQYVEGNKGVYQLMLVETKPTTVSRFREKAQKEKVPISKKYKNECGNDDIDRIFWRNIRYNPPTYGADMLGSLMGKDPQVWNLNFLDSILKVIKETVPGVTAPYLYFGMWKAMFAWHVEDMNLFSINYLHFGEPKSWYAIPSDYGKRFEILAQNYFPELAKICPEFLRHKTTLISPSIVEQNNIPMSKMVQKEGEIMITFPYAYHSGFNHGFNCAESVNFALESWIEYGKKARACTCSKEAVHINMEVFLARYQAWKEGSLDLETFEIDNTSAPLIDIPLELALEEPKVAKSPKKNPKKHKKPATIEPLPNEVSNKLEDTTKESPKKRPKKITLEQLQLLESVFEKNDGPDKKERETIAQQLGWTNGRVYHWFRRKRRSLIKDSKPPSPIPTSTTTTIVQPKRPITLTIKFNSQNDQSKLKITNLLNPYSENSQPLSKEWTIKS